MNGPSSSSTTTALYGTRSAKAGSTGGKHTVYEATRPVPRTGVQVAAPERHSGHRGRGWYRKAPQSSQRWSRSSWRRHQYQNGSSSGPGNGRGKSSRIAAVSADAHAWGKATGVTTVTGTGSRAAAMMGRTVVSPRR